MAGRASEEVKPLEALVETAKLLESVALTVMLFERFKPLAVKLLLTPATPCVATRPESDDGYADMAGDDAVEVTPKSSKLIFGLLPVPLPPPLK